MDITEKIRTEIIRYIERHGKEPLRVLLGVEEARELKEQIDIVATAQEFNKKLVLFEDSVLLIELKNSKHCVEAI